MTGILASVHNLREARTVLRSGVEVAVIDLKDPRRGVLGALPLPTIRAAVEVCGSESVGSPLVSATTGDLSLNDARLEGRILATREAGVDYVKVGVFEPPLGGALEAERKRMLARCAAASVPVVLVFFAEHLSVLPDVDEIATLGVAGVMVDTADKGSGPLTAKLGLPLLNRFVHAAQRAGLLCGLAGSLRERDIPPLLGLGADYLGFRGALCRGRDRTAALDEAALERIGRLFLAYNGGVYNERETVEVCDGA